MARVGDLVLFGQGSEWLWSLAQFVVVSVTALFVFRQLAAQRSASHYEHLTQVWQEFEAPPMVRAKLALMLAMRGRDPSRGMPPDNDEVPDFFERLGYLASRGHYKAESLWDDGSWTVIEFYWGLLRPYVERDRVTSNHPGLYRWFEWLEAVMRRQDARHEQQHPPFDQTQRESLIAARIDIFRAKLQRLEPGWGAQP